MKKLSKAEVSLQIKLQVLADGQDIELNKEEAALYGIDVADVLPDSDCFKDTLEDI